MAPNVTLETSFNPFIVHENMNENNQDLDQNFFHKSVSCSLDTDTVSAKDLKVSLKIVPGTLSPFYI